MPTNPAAEFTWQDSRRLIYDAVGRFRRRFGGRVDDLLSTAHEAFMDAWAGYDDSLAEWSTHLQATVWWALRRERQAGERRREVRLTDQPARDGFDVECWTAELSNDAR